MPIKKNAEISTAKPAVEIISDSKKLVETPMVTIKTGMTGNKTTYFKINQPKGRALLIAVHL